VKLKLKDSDDEVDYGRGKLGLSLADHAS